MFIIGGLFSLLAGVVGTSDTGLRLILSILAGYPLVRFYQNYVRREQQKEVHHLFFIISGIGLCCLNYGNGVGHSLIAVSFTYVILTLFPYVPEVLIAASFIFHMAYLTVGYYVRHTDEYDISWTMPHSVLVLRLIGLAFNVADGLKAPTELTKEQGQTALKNVPTVLEIFGFAYFPFTFLIGPQVDFKRYQQFINGEFSIYTGAERAGIRRFVGGVAYMAVNLIGNHFLPNSYLLSENYRKEFLPVKLLLMGVWAKVVFCRYISCWLLAEGTLMCLGFTYNGNLPDGQPDWSGCSNVAVFEFETGEMMEHYIKSFNIGTNYWIARYVFKRLKHFEQRLFSHLASLMFLASWHGLHSGYYVSFLLEFLVVTAERQMTQFYRDVMWPKYAHILSENYAVWEYCRFIILKTYDIILMGFCMVPFVFLTFDKYTRVYGAVYYFGFVFLGLWFGFYHFHTNRNFLHN